MIVENNLKIWLPKREIAGLFLYFSIVYRVECLISFKKISLLCVANFSLKINELISKFKAKLRTSIFVEPIETT